MSVVVVGLGAIGEAIARALGRELCAVADVRADAPDVGAPAHRTAEAAFATPGARVAVLCTGSRLPAIQGEIEAALGAGLHVITTAEEMAYPALRHRERAQGLDAHARAVARVVLGTGVNPGFVMDRFAVAVAQACVRVDAVSVERIVDVSSRREALRKKLGVGLTEAGWRAAAARGALGHVGLGESAALLALGFGWPHCEVHETLEPVLQGGFSQGCRQTASAASGRVALRIEMFAGASEPRDRVRIDGDPPVEVTIAGGLQGERATVGAVLRAVSALPALAPGLRTVLDLPLAGGFGKALVEWGGRD